MAITASDVNKLRQQTGAGMMDCKNALVEANGDFEAAIDILRKKGQKIAAKRGDNDAKEGIILAQTAADGQSGIILGLNCETDFVAKNEGYVTLVQSLVDIALAHKPDTADALKAVAYNHPGNQLATLVGFSADGSDMDEVGRQIAMQVAAMNPIAIDKSGVDQRTIERELEIGKELAIQEGKPAEMAEKISQGRLNKFFKENTLLSQQFIRDDKLTVEQFLENTASGLTVTEFKRFSLS